MISRIIKLAAIAVIAVLCIIALYTFWKKIRNMTKSQAKAEFKKLRLIRVDAFVFAVIICVVYTLVTYFDTTKQANAVVGLNYAEASLGQNVNGTRYNMAEIICDDVLERTIKKGGYDDLTVSDLKECLSVAPLNQGNSYSKDSYHISTEFAVYYYAGKKTQKYDSETLLQLVCNSYRDYYFDKYVNDFQIKLDDIEDEVGGLDYIDAADLLSRKANRILNYLYGLRQKNSSFISSKGTTFDSVAAKVDILNSARINDALYSYVLQNGVSADSERLLSRLDYINVQSGFDKQELEQSYAITNKAVARYDSDMARIVLVPTWDKDGKYYMGRTKIGIDELSVQAVSYSKSIASVEKGINDNNLKIEKFRSAVGNTAENRAYAASLISEIESSLKSLAEEARLIGQEYYSNQMNQCISANVSSYSLLSKAKVLLLILVCSYIAFWAKKSSAVFGTDNNK